ncbi:MAG: hypothetical protein ACFE85_09710 [Candidatus Hodarchaeota archaeon]
MSKKSNIDLPEVIKSGSAPGTSTSIASAAALLGADLVVVALAWDNPPSEGGIITITFLMLISFVAFINVMHSTMRAELLIARIGMKEMDEEIRGKDSRELIRILKWLRVMHVSGLLFTMLAFWIISYKYLISINGYNFIILLLPFILFILYWLPKIIGVEREVTLLSRESLVQFLIQIVFLILICLDFIRIITIF